MGYRLGISPERRARLEAELERLLGLLRVDPQVRLVILFGSLAQGRVGPSSDLDLLVVRESDQRFLERTADLYTALLPRVGLDLLVYTPEEFRQLQVESSFVRQAVQKGKVLYEAGARA